jgi:hypothetical protein
VKRRTVLLGVLGLMSGALSLGAPPARADLDEIAVVVNKANGIGTMNRSQLNAIFMAKATEFPGGGRATPVNLPPENPFRREFDSVVLGMRPDEVERFWLDNRIRSGVGSPRKLPAPSSIVRFVSGDPSGIGYAPSSELDGSIRVVARIRGGQVRSP